MSYDSMLSYNITKQTLYRYNENRYNVLCKMYHIMLYQVPVYHITLAFSMLYDTPLPLDLQSHYFTSNDKTV